MRYSNSSQYRNTQFVKDYLDLYEPAIEINMSATKLITVANKYHMRPDLLAFDLYGDSSLWWVLVIYNRDILFDPFNDLLPGIELRVPNNMASIGV